MGRFRVSYIVVVIALLFALVTGAHSDVAPISLKLRQAEMRNGALDVYLNLIGENEVPVLTGEVANFSAELDSRKLNIVSANVGAKQDGTAILLLVDVSKSINVKDFDKLKGTILSYIRNKRANDQFAIVSFGKTVTLVQDFTDETKTLAAKIEGLKLTDDLTLLNRGLLEGMKITGRRTENFPVHRAIIVLSDGINDFQSGGVTADEVAKEISRTRIPIHALLYTPPSNTAGNKEKIDVFGKLVRDSGGMVSHVSPSKAIEKAFEEIGQIVDGVWLLKIDASEISLDEKEKNLDIKWSKDGVAVTGSAKFVFLKGDMVSAISTDVIPEKVESVVPSVDNTVMYAAISGGALLALIIAFIVFRKKKGIKNEGKAVVISAPEEKTKPVGKLKLKIMISMTPVRNGISYEPVTRSFSESLKIGRSSQNDFALPDDGAISSRHCEIFFQEGFLYVRDLGSTNGTQLNKNMVTGHIALNDGDVLHIGETDLKISLLQV